jgi:IclR family transcriptional regulator, KDG regulon repressor
VPRVVPAVARALGILELFLTSRTLSVPEISARLGLPRSTAHELAQTLVASGFLSPQENQPHRFALGLRVFELGSSYASNIDLIREGVAVMREVAEACDETTQLAVLDGNQVVYVAKQESSHTLRLVSTVGGRLPAHVTAGGKMLLSGFSDEAVSIRYGNSSRFPGMTQHSITSLEGLFEELCEIRATGLAFDNCESNPDVRCVAAPVFNQSGAMVAAVSVSVPVTRMTTERAPQLADLIRKGAESLSYRLGHRPATWVPELGSHVAMFRKLAPASPLIESPAGSQVWRES